MGWVKPPDATGVAPADTLEFTIETGTVLTTTLPATLAGTEVRRYRLIDGPPFSGVAGRSLAWPAADADPGTYEIVLVPDTDAPTDTLFVQVQVDANA